MWHEIEGNWGNSDEMDSNAGEKKILLYKSFSFELFLFGIGIYTQLWSSYLVSAIWIIHPVSCILGVLGKYWWNIPHLFFFFSDEPPPYHPLVKPIMGQSLRIDYAKAQTDREGGQWSEDCSGFGCLIVKEKYFFPWRTIFRFFFYTLFKLC